MASLKYATVVFALVSALLAQSSAPVAPDKPSQPPANSQEAARTSTPAAPAVPDDSTQIEPIQTVQPIYPNSAREQNIRGQVVVMIIVSEAGEVMHASVVSGDAQLSDAAIEAAKKWRFKPFLTSGPAAAAAVTLSFEFGVTSGATAAESSADPWVVRSSISHSRILHAGGVTPGIIIKKVDPKYPKAAKKARVQGSVVVAVVISKEGTIKDLRVVSGPPELADAAVAAVKQWRYKPYLMNGLPVEVDSQITVNFQLNGG